MVLADHLKLSAHFLNLFGLSLKSCGEGLNLPFLQRNPCLQVLHGLTLFEELVHRKRMARRGDAELAICIYDNRVAAHGYTRNAADKAGADELRVADADGLLSVVTGIGGCADVDVIASVGEVVLPQSRRPPC